MDLLRKIWLYGSKEPTQRVGILILAVGFISLFFWTVKAGFDIEIFYDPRYFPDKRDSFFFHLYLYLIPLGLLLSWGYEVVQKLKTWVLIGAQQKIHASQKSKILHFKDSKSAIEFASTIFSKSFDNNRLSIGIITSKLTSNTEKPIFIIRLADQERVIVSGINDKHSNYLGVGHLIYWKFVEKVNYEVMPEIEAIGYIVATLENSFNPETKKWVVMRDLT